MPGAEGRGEQPPCRHHCKMIAVDQFRWFGIVAQGQQDTAAVTTAVAHAARIHHVGRLVYQAGFFCFIKDGKGFFLVFRFYGPTEGYIDKTWVLNDFEKLD